jgi:hypothetical protein
MPQADKWLQDKKQSGSYIAQYNNFSQALASINPTKYHIAMAIVGEMYYFRHKGK